MRHPGLRVLCVVIWLLGVVWAGTITPAPVMAAPAPPYAVVQVPRLNVRAAPSTQAPVVGQVAEQERLTVLGRNAAGTWLRIESAGGVSGWVYAALVQPSVPIAALDVYQAAPVNVSTAEATAAPATGEVQRVAYTAETGRTAAPIPATPPKGTPASNPDPRPVSPNPQAASDAVQATTAVLQPLCRPNRLRTVTLAGRPRALTTMDNRLYVALAEVSSLMIVDTARDMLLGTSRTTAESVVYVAAADGSIYVADEEGRRLVITTAQGAVKATVDLPGRPGPLAVAGNRAFVLHPDMGAVSVVDVQARQVLATLSVGADPRQVAVVGNRAFIAHNAGFLSVVDAQGQRHEELLLPVNDVVGMAADARAGILYLAGGADQKVVAVDVGTWTLVNTWTLDVLPSSLAFNPATGHVFVLDRTGQFLSVLSAVQTDRMAQVQIQARPMEDPGHSLAVVQSKIYVMNPAEGQLEVWLDRTCPGEAPQGTATLTTYHSRTDLTPRRVEARIGILWPHGGATPDQASYANLTAVLLREDGAVPACAWEPKVTLWAAVGGEPARPVAEGQRRMVTENGVTFPVYDFNDVDVRVTRDRRLPIHFMVKVDGVDTAQNVWTHSATGQFLPTVRPELEGVVQRAGGPLDARLWVEETSRGREMVAMLLKADTLLALAPGVGEPVPQLRWAVDNGVTEPELVVGRPEVRREGGLIFTVWRFPGLDPDALLREHAQVRFWVEIPEVEVHSSVLAWGQDIRTLGARLPVPAVGCTEEVASR